MGTWGPGPFDGDAPADFLEELVVVQVVGPGEVAVMVGTHENDTAALTSVTASPAHRVPAFVSKLSHCTRGPASGASAGGRSNPEQARDHARCGAANDLAARSGSRCSSVRRCLVPRASPASSGVDVEEQSSTSHARAGSSSLPAPSSARAGWLCPAALWLSLGNACHREIRRANVTASARCFGRCPA